MLIHDQDHPRGFWKIARVQSLITGKDGVVRGASLKVASKGGPPTTLQRPLQLLYPLEIESSSSVTDATERGQSTKQQVASGETSPQQEVTQTTSRPQRAAAVRGRQVVKQWCTPEELIDHTYM